MLEVLARRSQQDHIIREKQRWNPVAPKPDPLRPVAAPRNSVHKNNEQNWWQRAALPEHGAGPAPYPPVWQFLIVSTCVPFPDVFYSLRLPLSCCQSISSCHVPPALIHSHATVSLLRFATFVFSELWYTSEEEWFCFDNVLVRLFCWNLVLFHSVFVFPPFGASFGL